MSGVNIGRTRYTRGRDPALAFEVNGDGGGIDVVLVGPLLTHVELVWEEPTLARLNGRLAALGRLLRYDRRGTGMSDASPGPWTLAEEVDDLVAVLDAAQIDRAAVISYAAGGPLACLLAATHPDRVGSLILDTCSARQTYDDDYVWAPTLDERAAMMAAALETWGEGDWIARFAPTWAADEAARAWMGRTERMAASPGAAFGLLDSVNDVDVRGVLPSIRAPTLVVRRSGEMMFDRRHSLYLIEHIAGARLVELKGQDALPWGDGGDAWVDLVGEFAAGAPPPASATRGLATLLFTDIVDSTATVDRVGDTEWRSMLERHDALASSAIIEAGGRVVKSLGDGVFARFDAVPDAVAAARRLVSEAAGIQVDVRAGVHLGDCEFVGDDLAGRTVHEAARVSALARAGEILLSDVAHGLLAGSDVETQDRGLHRLKGFKRPYRLWSIAPAAASTA